MSDRVIPASTRYECARGELTQRISNRLQINVYYVAAVGTFLAAYVAVSDDTTHISPVAPIIIPGIILPLISGMFYCWYTHNELVTGYLSAYCAALEDQSDEQGLEIAGWFNHSRSISFERNHYEGLQMLTARARRRSDWGMIIGFVPSPIICLLKLITSDVQERIFVAILVVLSGVTAIVLCAGLLNLSDFRRDVLKKRTYRQWF